MLAIEASEIMKTVLLLLLLLLHSPRRLCFHLHFCLLAGLHKNYSTSFHKIWWKGGTWAMEEPFGGNPECVTLRLELG